MEWIAKHAASPLKNRVGGDHRTAHYRIRHRNSRKAIEVEEVLVKDFPSY